VPYTVCDVLGPEAGGLPLPYVARWPRLRGPCEGNRRPSYHLCQVGDPCPGCFRAGRHSLRLVKGSRSDVRLALRQCLRASVAAWAVVLVGTTVWWYLGDRPWLAYLSYTAITIACLLPISGWSFLGRQTTLGFDKWGIGRGRYGRDEGEGDWGAQGLTALGVNLVVIPQLVLVGWLLLPS
jgi:hypothetical protein